MSRTFWQLLFGLTLFGAVVAFTTHHVMKTEPRVSDAVHTLLVCVNADGSNLYSGVVDIHAFNNNLVIFEEPNTGLRRRFVNATCILTKGTEAQFAAAAPPTPEGPTNGDGR
jgi:hypothetical protein